MPSVFARPNKFNRSHTNLLTCDMGKLVPFFVEEVLPGDEYRVKTDAVIRLAPMLAPIFGEIDFYTHYFFVPNRLLWDNWENFITNGLESGVSTAVWPYITGGTGTNWQIGSLADYLGIPVADAEGPLSGGVPTSVVSPNGVEFSALPFRAYAKIWNDWYRNEFLQNEITFSTADGADTTTNLGLLSRSWRRDYLTSALPFTQLGTAAQLGLGGTAVVRTGGTGIDVTGMGGLVLKDVSSNSGLATALGTTSGGTVANVTGSPSLGSSRFAPANLIADLSTATALNVNDVRLAFQLQRMMERKARSGNRYVEYLAASFGVRSPDARLQRAEFLGGGKSPVMISEVLQTSEGTATSPQGQMSGHGFGAARTHAFSKSFTEHGFIMGILSIMPKTGFFQGRERMWYRQSYTDYAQPELYHIGEQGILNSEVVANAVNPTDVFGYQPRYEEYRRKLSGCHGDFRTNLNYWHLMRGFGSTTVALNSQFVECTPSKRIFAAGAQAVRPCWVEMFIDAKAVRCLSKHGNPGYIDH